MNSSFTFEVEPFSSYPEINQHRSASPFAEHRDDFETTSPQARPINRHSADMAACNERATRATHCASPQVCPPIPVLLCGYGIDGVPFEYVGGKTSNGRSQIQRAANGLFRVVESPPKRERFRPEVRDALRQFLGLMTQFGMPVQAILTMGSYNCRCIKGQGRVSNRFSNHAYGDAIDITGVRWAASSRAPGRPPETIIHNWRQAPVERGLLRRINACLRLCFKTVIDQSYNAAHRNHFHCDMNVSNGGRRRHDTTTWVFVQDALKNVLGYSSVRHDGRLNDSTKDALSRFSGIPASRLSPGRDIDVALDRLFTHVASGAVASPPTPEVEGFSDRFEFDENREFQDESQILSKFTDLGLAVGQEEYPIGETGVFEEAGDVWSGEATTPSPNPIPGNSASPVGPFGVLTIRSRPNFRYAFTAEDALWLARFVIGEAGGRDDSGSRAVIWTMFNRYAFFTNRVYPTFSSFIRAYSTPLQAVLNSGGAAARHYQNPDFVRTGGNYSDRYAHVPRGQRGRYLRLQATPWSSLPASARGLAESVLRGQVPNPIGNASDFANTAVYYWQKHGQWPTLDQWRAYNVTLARQKNRTWIGDVQGLTQFRKNTFFVDNRVAQLPQGAVVISGVQSQPAPAQASASAPQVFWSALRQGERNENKLTNIIFFARHPERDGQAIRRNEANFQALSREWISIRDNLVRPALRGGTVTPSGGGATGGSPASPGPSPLPSAPPPAPASAASGPYPQVSVHLNGGLGLHGYGRPERRFGHALAVLALITTGVNWFSRHQQGPRIGIGDISKLGGGLLPPHKSHQKGVDVDIRLMRNDGGEARTTYQSQTYSRSLTQELVNLILNNGVMPVEFILFNDPQVTGVRPWPSHDNHLHVRFRLPAGAQPEVGLLREETIENQFVEPEWSY